MIIEGIRKWKKDKKSGLYIAYFEEQGSVSGNKSWERYYLKIRSGTELDKAIQDYISRK